MPPVPWWNLSPAIPWEPFVTWSPYPLLGMVCLPETDGTGRLVVAVADDGRLDRLMAELSGLPEVVGARVGDLRSGTLAAFLGEAVVV
ncbi:MAG: hypothetical protein AB9872_17185 [Solidesulfovibrio sp.]